jgi:hypothetical protein
MAPVRKGRKPGPGFRRLPRESLTEPIQIKSPIPNQTKLLHLSFFIVSSAGEENDLSV